MIRCYECKKDLKRSSMYAHRMSAMHRANLESVEAHVSEEEKNERAKEEEEDMLPNDVEQIRKLYAVDPEKKKCGLCMVDCGDHEGIWNMHLKTVHHQHLQRLFDHLTNRLDELETDVCKLLIGC
jgi:hypothetical protein